MIKNKLVFNLLLIIGLLFGSYANSFALSAKGYIVTLKSDTVYGWVQLGRFDQTTGGFILNGIETESYSWRVVFATNEEKRYKTYFPEMILGFRFVYKSEEYIYERTAVTRKSLFKNESQQYRFSRIVSKDKNGAYSKNLRVSPNPGLESNRDKFLKHEQQQFQIKVDSTKKIEKNNSAKEITK
jgi:hypothetical protein